MKFKGIPPQFSDIYRSVPEDVMIELLILEGDPYNSNIQAAQKEARIALEGSIASGLGVRTTPSGQRLFDPVEVSFVLKTVTGLGRDNYWRNRMVPTLRRFVADLAETPDQPVSMSYRRRFYTGELQPDRPLRLRVPLPLNERYSNLIIDPTFPENTIQHRMSDGRLEVRVSPGPEPYIDVAAEFSFANRNMSRSLSLPADFDIFLKHKDGLVVASEPIQALSKHLSRSDHSDTRVRAFWNFVMDEFLFCPVHYDQVPADRPLDWVLETKTYDCQLASALFVALCRASNIPARIVGGNFLYKRSPTNHYWAEVWLENSGWTPFDFLSWDLSEGSTSEPWHDHFFGHLDSRLISECLPLAFLGSVGVPIPSKWHILRRVVADGVLVRLEGLDGKPIYDDFIALT
jgi:hypothetical protein